MRVQPGWALPVAVTLCLALAGCAAGTSGTTVYARVDRDVTAVQVPALAVVTPNLDAGFPSDGQPTTPTQTRQSSVSALTSLGTFLRLESVEVSRGDTVKAGQVIARLDSGALAAGTAIAQANAAVATAQVPVLDAAIDKTTTSTSDLASAREQLESTIADLTATRATLAEKLAQTKDLLASLPPGEAVQPSSPEPTAPTDTTPSGSPAGTSETQQATPTQQVPSAAELQAAIAQLEASIAQIDAGLAKAREGVAQLASASATVDDARTQLTNVRSLAVVAADATRVAVKVAQAQESYAAIVAPVDGVVLTLASVGDVLAPGATVATIAALGPSTVTTWLSPAQAARLHVGDLATIYGDWMASASTGSGADVAATVTAISPSAEYPPTSFATRDVHLTRAVKVQLTVRGTASALPAGVPVDVTFPTLPRSLA